MANWEQKINAELALHGDRRVNGKVASVRTQNLTKEVLYACFRRLHELGYRVEDPKNFKEKHIEVLVHDWWYTKKKSIKTIRNELSRLRVFFGKAGKPGLVGPLEKYLPDVDPKELVVHAATRQSKSWVSRGADMIDVFKRVDARDRQLGLMLRMMLTFGLRMEEAIKCVPHVQDEGNYFAVLPGQGKGGRRRSIPALERQVLDYVKSQTPLNEALGWKWTRSGEPATLKQNIKRFSNLMASLGFTKKELGVTGHGLRAQFAENRALQLGVIPPSLGGACAQLPKDELRLRMTKISEALGHHRPQIVAAYFCAFGRKTFIEDDYHTMLNIETALAVLAARDLPPVPDERRADCMKIRETLEVLGSDLTLKQAHALWTIACKREGVEWKEPKAEIAIVLEGAALTLLANERNKKDQA